MENYWGKCVNFKEIIIDQACRMSPHAKTQLRPHCRPSGARNQSIIICMITAI